MSACLARLFAVPLALLLLAMLVAPAEAQGECAWTQLPKAGAPTPREGAVAAWTGTEMLVWGGTGQAPNGILGDVLGTGAAYSPTSNTWRTLPTDGAPSPRGGESAVWTGTELLIWGGGTDAGARNDGAAYDPGTNTWRALPTDGAPSPRSGATAVWDGTEMLVWGGGDDAGYRDDGGAYNPAANTWRPLPVVGAPSPRVGATAVWTGTEMLIWGGVGCPGRFYEFCGDGATYNPAANTWRPITAAGAPPPRDEHTAVWTGSEMLIWGGFEGERAGERAVVFGPGMLADGGAYDPATDTWRPIATAGAPSQRKDQTAVWTGTEMLIWGGFGPLLSPLGGGGAYDPESNTWRPLPQAGAPGPRFGQVGVWTGDKMLIWGGSGNPDVIDYFGDGAAYTPPAAPACRFVLGFLALHDALPTIVGDCLDNEQHNPANGDALQHTTHGLLVWRKADNFTAFTDGYHTWVAGPYGIQKRLNSQRFPWEANPSGLPVVR